MYTVGNMKLMKVQYEKHEDACKIHILLYGSFGLSNEDVFTSEEPSVD